MVAPLLRRVYLPEGFEPMLGWRPAPGLQFGWIHGSPCCAAYWGPIHKGDIYKKTVGTLIEDQLYTIT